MKVGIVGSEGVKFTALGEARARAIIADLLKEASDVVSGACHLGGIDIWAEEEADRLGIGKLIFPPREQTWAGGYKPRNLQIARNSDIVYCLSVDKLPPDYKGMTFNQCYHCAKAGWPVNNHVKSGGCWTMHQAIKLGKQGQLIVVEN